eukprot:1443483-Pyramimonas_sp.AAC.1
MQRYFMKEFESKRDRRTQRFGYQSVPIQEPAFLDVPIELPQGLGDVSSGEFAFSFGEWFDASIRVHVCQHAIDQHGHAHGDAHNPSAHELFTRWRSKYDLDGFLGKPQNWLVHPTLAVMHARGLLGFDLYQLIFRERVRDVFFPSLLSDHVVLAYLGTQKAPPRQRGSDAEQPQDDRKYALHVVGRRDAVRGRRFAPAHLIRSLKVQTGIKSIKHMQEHVQRCLEFALPGESAQ